MRSHRRILWYVAKETVFSFLVAFLFFFFFMFFVNQILLLAEQIISKKVPLWDVMLLIFYSLPQFMLLSFPFGTLVGTLMAVGRLSSDNELLAFQSLGVPSSRLLIPLVLLGCLFTATSFLIYDYLMPMGNIQFSALIRRLIYSNPTVELEPWAVKKFENTVIVTGDVERNALLNVLIIDRTAEDDRRIITARRASLRESEQKDVVSLELDDVFTHQGYAKEGDRYDYTVARSMVYNILLKNIAGTVSLGALGPSQQSSVDVWKEIRKKQADQTKRQEDRDAQARQMLFSLSQELRTARGAVSRAPGQLEIKRRGLESLQRDLSLRRAADLTDRTLQNYLLEFHKKFSIPAACLVFSLFAFPVGRVARRSGRTVGFGIGLFVAIFYWGLLFAGNTLGVRMGFSPAMSMWLPDILVLLGGSVFFLVGRKR